MLVLICLALTGCASGAGCMSIPARRNMDDAFTWASLAPFLFGAMALGAGVLASVGTHATRHLTTQPQPKPAVATVTDPPTAAPPEPEP